LTPQSLLQDASDILARIVSRKQDELNASKQPAAELRRLAESAQPNRRDFTAALHDKRRSKRPAIISEIKKASPSRGVLIADFRPVELAQQYEKGGAAALSVLTDRDFFQGSNNDLEAARAACNLPVIRKDFTISEYHVLEAASIGADAILLIAAILDESQLRAFRDLAREFEMAALVEVHNAHELEIALRSGAEIIGINNRDLRTFNVSLETSIALAPQIPPALIKVSESGIFTSADIHRLLDAGFDAFLVGEHLIKSGDATRALQELVA
jgi:indole-3-glycerol phosphate synthase